MSRVSILGFVVLFGLSGVGYAQAPTPPTDAWLVEARRAWLKSSEAETRGVRNDEDLMASGFVEVVGRVSNMSDLELSDIHVLVGDSLVLKRKSNRAGLFYIPLFPKHQYQVRLITNARPVSGSFYLPETEGVAFLDVVLGAGGDGQMMALIGLHTNRQEQKAPREALPSTPTGVALASAPLKIERNASIESLRAGLRPIDGRSRLSNRTEQALSERSLSSSNVAPALDMGLDEYAASLFETQGLPTHSDDPEIRRIWRLIANARTPDDMAQAQMALGDYHSKMGNQALAEISYRRAQYWKGRGR